MHEAVARMLDRYRCRSLDDYGRALREIIQEVALLGLWRSKFFEHAAFYGGTALRILYGLDRFSEDLDFSLLEPSKSFDLGRFSAALEEEVRAFGFEVRVENVEKTAETAVQSAFLKADTRREMLVMETAEEILRQVPRGQTVRIKLEIDTDPPGGFTTETRYLLVPIPFAVRTYTLPDLFAGKIHALLCRRWKNRVKGRDWYDFVWYAAHHPELNLAHLERRMRQTGHWAGEESLDGVRFFDLLHAAIERLDIRQARDDVAPFLRNPEVLDLWSVEFFRAVAGRIRIGGEELERKK